MKRSWVGLIFLAVLLIASLAVTWGMQAIHQPVSRDLELAAGKALAGDWAGARALAGDAAARWHQWDHLRACLADHGPMEEVEAVFARLGCYADAGEEAEFAATCAELARRVADMGEAHGLSLWNLF